MSLLVSQFVPVYFSTIKRFLLRGHIIEGKARSQIKDLTCTVERTGNMKKERKEQNCETNSITAHFKASDKKH